MTSSARTQRTAQIHHSLHRPSTHTHTQLDMTSSGLLGLLLIALMAGKGTPQQYETRGQTLRGEDEEAVPLVVYDDADDSLALEQGSPRKRPEVMYGFGLGKRRSYGFGIGRRSADRSDPHYAFGLGRRSADKKDPQYAFGLGRRSADKRAPQYGFGLGKRNMEYQQLPMDDDVLRNKRKSYGFGLGKRQSYGFGLGKRQSYGFGLGKRQSYGFGLGKRSWSNWFDYPNRDMPKRPNYGFGLGKRSLLSKTTSQPETLPQTIQIPSAK